MANIQPRQLSDEELHRLWAVEMDIMKEFARICEKHGLRWWATGGSMLGAIRHNGFIPWDDDMDAAMTAEDFRTFIEAARTELKEPYELQYYTEGDWLQPWHAKIRRSDTTGCTTWEAKYMPESYNKGVFFDIFPLYGLPDDPAEQARLIKKLKRLQWPISAAQQLHHPASRKSFKHQLGYIAASCSLALQGGYQKACEKFVRLCETGGAHTEKISYLSFKPGDKRFIWPRALIDTLVEHPFEQTTVPVPSRYDEWLTIRYGEYMKPVKGAAVHSGLVLDLDTPYREYFRK